jgi:hypothetical protein
MGAAAAAMCTRAITTVQACLLGLTCGVTTGGAAGCTGACVAARPQLRCCCWSCWVCAAAAREHGWVVLTLVWHLLLPGLRYIWRCCRHITCQSPDCMPRPRPSPMQQLLKRRPLSKAAQLPAARLCPPPLATPRFRAAAAAQMTSVAAGVVADGGMHLCKESAHGISPTAGGDRAVMTDDLRTVSQLHRRLRCPIPEDTANA